VNQKGDPKANITQKGVPFHYLGDAILTQDVQYAFVIQSSDLGTVSAG
jgi:hypothetical protein